MTTPCHDDLEFAPQRQPRIPRQDELVLNGDAGAFTTRTSFRFDQNTLKRISSEANYADVECQFDVLRQDGHWYIQANEKAANATTVCGDVIGAGLRRLYDGDVIALLGRKSGNTAMRLTVSCYDINSVDFRGRGCGDVVFLVDVSQSMSTCLDVVKDFVSRVSRIVLEGGGWRTRVIGYRNPEVDGDDWYVGNPFVDVAGEIEKQLGRLEAKGGGTSEGLLDALYKVAAWGNTEKGARDLDAEKWRYRDAAFRYVILFTDASYTSRTTLPEEPGLSWEDVANRVMQERLRLTIFAPEMDCYDDLSNIDKAEYVPIAYDSAVTGDAAQRLREFLETEPIDSLHRSFFPRIVS